MKKTYFIPETKAIRIETTSIIATSDQVGLNKTTEVNDNTKLLGREFDFTGDDEE